MKRYVLRRIVELPIVLLGISTVLFLVLRLSGDPIALLVPSDATREDIELLREHMGLNKPVYVQYLKFLHGLATFDFGDSLVAGRPALELVLDRLPATLQLSLASMCVAVALAVPVGLLATRKDRVGNVVAVISLIGQGMPVFWLGVIFILIFSVNLRLLPSYGSGDIRHLVLPTLSLGLIYMAKTSRLVRSGLLEVMGEDYVRTARAKGLSGSAVVRHHVLRNAAIPIVTSVGVDVGYLLSGAVVTEMVFTWPGLGRQLMQAVLARDYPVVQASVFVVATMTVIVNLVIDLLNAHLDPRIAYGAKDS